MKPVSYKRAIQWIAENDNPGSDAADNTDEVSGYLTVVMVADLFGKEPFKVACDVLGARFKEQLRKGKQE